MADYVPPLEDMKFVLRHIAQYDAISALPGNEDADWDLVEAVLEEAGKVASGVISPLNGPGDLQGSKHTGDGVKTPDGWKSAFDEVAVGGWIGLACDPEFGGQGLPLSVGSATSEMWESASMSFALCNLLTQGAIDALELNGTEELKAIYLAPMIEGKWTGTMNLTEPQAGSDLSAVRTKAIPQGDHYRISGQKIFITYGDHDLTDNIVHLVLGRLPDAPAGVKGISLFVVPKILVNDDGTLGEANDVHCVSLEHKLGIHASPTAVMSFGDNDGAIGYLVGEANRGLEYMFVMMNRARFEMGLQGIGLAEMAYQRARDYALERVQGKPVGRDLGTPIIGHPDVRRMLLDMKSRIEAMRAVAYYTAGLMDHGAKDTNEEARKLASERVEYLIPIIKGWCTETGQELASVAVQVHGGVGYVEETGVAQYYRDARIMTIYEGTTAIQANDLIFRKVLRDKGAVAKGLIDEMRALDRDLTGDGFGLIRAALSKGADSLEQATDWFLQNSSLSAKCAAGGYNYLRLAGVVLGGFFSAKSALIAKAQIGSGVEDDTFLKVKIETAVFYAGHVMPEAQAFASKVCDGADAVFGLTDEQF